MARLFTPAFILVFIANIFTGIAWSLSIHLSRFLEDLGAAEAQIGLILSAAAVAAVIVKPWVGTALDRRGRRPIIIAGTLVQVVATFLYFTVDAVDAWAYAVRILHGIAIGTLFTALSTYAADIVPADRRTQGLALFGVSGMLPVALGGVVGDVVIGSWGYDAFFWTWVSVAVLAAVFSLPLAEAIRPDPDHPPLGFLSALGTRFLRPVWFITLAFAMALAAHFTFMATFISEAGFGSVGLFFSMYAAVAIFERLTIGWLPDRIGPKKVLYPALAAMAAGLVALAIADSAVWVGIAGGLAGAGHGFVFPILYALTVERIHVSDRGSAVSIYTALFDVGQLLAAPVWGLIIEGAGYTPMYITVASGLLVAGVVFAAWDAKATQAAAAVAAG